MDFLEDSQPPVWDDGPSEGHLPVAVAARAGRGAAPAHRAPPTTASSGAGTGFGFDLAAAEAPPRLLLRGERDSCWSAARSTPPPRNLAASRSEQSANLWWPADRAWCVVTDIDLMSTLRRRQRGVHRRRCSPRRAGGRRRRRRPTRSPMRHGQPLAVAPLRHASPVRLLVVRVLAAFFALTWLVLPGFGLIDLSVTWDPDWPVVLEASWGVFMTVLVGGSFLAARRRPAPDRRPRGGAAGRASRRWLARRRGRPGVAAARLRRPARRAELVVLLAAASRTGAAAAVLLVGVGVRCWSSPRSGSCRGCSTPSGCSRATAGTPA